MEGGEGQEGHAGWEGQGGWDWKGRRGGTGRKDMRDGWRDGRDGQGGWVEAWARGKYRRDGVRGMGGAGTGRALLRRYGACVAIFWLQQLEDDHHRMVPPA